MSLWDKVYMSKRASAWDTLVSIANGDGVPIHKVHPAYGNAFHSVTDQDMTGPDGGTVHVGPGEVAYGFEKDEPGILAHELGHVKAWGKYGTPRKKITELSRALSNKPILPAALPVAGALASYITKNPAWLTGASAISLASVAPMLLDEHNANEEGEKLVEQVGGTDEDKDVVSGGLGHKLLRTAGVPAAGLLGGVLLSAMRKKASFEDVKAIYDSLPEDQKKLVSPRGAFVDSPNLQLRVLNKDKTGFAEAYKLKGGPKDSAFVTLAVRPDAQGKGEATAIMRELISQAREKKIKKLVYRLASENDASRHVIQKFVDSPKRKFKDSEEYEIDTEGGPDEAEAIYKNLTDEQKHFLDGGFEHVTPERLNLDAVLAQRIIPGTGYGRIWKADTGNNEIEIAVANGMQGKGVGKKLLNELIAQAKAKKLGEVLYRPHSNNAASNALVRSVTGQKGEDDGEYTTYKIKA